MKYFDRYDVYIEFKCNLPNFFLSPCVAIDKVEVKLPLCITERDILASVSKLSNDYQPPLSKVQY
jgi:hypothetical protein